MSWVFVPVASPASELEAGELDDRRREVHEAHHLADPLRLDAGPGDHERHAELRVVDVAAGRQLAVLAERLAVIGRDDDDRAIVRRAPRERAEHHGDHRVGRGERVVVELLALLVGARLRGPGAPVARLGDVDPHEPRGSPGLPISLTHVEPGARPARERGAARLDLDVRETARQPAVGVPQLGAADEAGGVVAGGGQALREQHVAGIEARARVVEAAVHAVRVQSERDRRQ